GSRGRGADLDRRRCGVALHCHGLSRAEGELRFQRFYNLLGAGPVAAAGPHAPDLAPWPAARSGRARATDYEECVRSIPELRKGHKDHKGDTKFTGNPISLAEILCVLCDFLVLFVSFFSLQGVSKMAVNAPLNRKLRMGLIGGGQGAFIGRVHATAA